MHTGCLECVAICPAEGALDIALPLWRGALKKRRLPAWVLALGIAGLFLGIVGFAKTAGYWNGDVPDTVYRQLVPNANEVSHPGD
jgi:ferredoxin